MKDITVNELKNGMKKALLEMGINADFSKNPAFADIANELGGFIQGKNLFERGNELIASRGDSSISLDFGTDNNGNFAMDIKVDKSNLNKITCLINDKSSAKGANHQTKDCDKYIIELGKGGGIDVKRYRASVDNRLDYEKGHYNCADKCHISTSITHDIYNDKGNKDEYEHTSWGGSTLGQSFERANPEAMLYMPETREATDNHWQVRTLIRRDGFGTAQATHQDKGKNESFSGKIKLDNRDGYKGLVPLSNYGAFVLADKENERQ